MGELQHDHVNSPISVLHEICSNQWTTKPGKLEKICPVNTCSIRALNIRYSQLTREPVLMSFLLLLPA